MGGWLQHLLHTVPPLAVYLVVAGVVGLESLGIPLPGELALVTAALMASTGHTIDPLWVGLAASTGAIVGDSIGYAIGHRGGRGLLAWLGRTFPTHFGPSQVAVAERVFKRWGIWAVFFGRFIALLRIFAGPLAGVLRMPYPKFLAANALGGICWAAGTTALVYYLGEVAEQWLGNFAWIGLIATIVGGLGVGWYIKQRTNKAARARAPAATARRTRLRWRRLDRSRFTHRRPYRRPGAPPRSSRRPATPAPRSRRSCQPARFVPGVLGKSSHRCQAADADNSAAAIAHTAVTK